MSVKRILPWAAAAMVAVVIGLGLRVTGWPSEARGVRLDGRRVERLNNLSFAIDRYYARHGRLPATLDELRDVSGTPTVDPGSGAPIEYRIRGAKGYELCAVFDHRTPSEDGSSFWWHAAGRQCYGLTLREPQR